MQSLFKELPPAPQAAFTTDYRQILEKMHHIDPVQYAKTRNHIRGAVTYLSPYLSRGVISVRQVQEAVISKGYPWDKMEKFLQELAWREYYQRVWQARGDRIRQDLHQPQPDVLHHQMIRALQDASTGIATIDSQIKNLYTNGYMHNHTRMYVASIACNLAKAHWLQPAQWLYYHLLDGDIASNNCSWQWVAGAFASKKYFCNQENINRYTDSRQQDSFLDKSYEAIATIPVPDVLKAVTHLQLQTLLPETPIPVIDTAKPTLLYNAYNLDPLWREKEGVNRILILEPSHFFKYPVSEKVIRFILSLSGNIAGIQLFCGEVSALASIYAKNGMAASKAFISKEHPAFVHYPGIRDSRSWLYPEVTGYYPSFSRYWKECVKTLSGN